MSALEEGIVISNRAIRASSKDIMFSLEEKINDPGTHYKATLWYPRAQKVQEVSETALDFIEKIKKEITEEALSISKKNIFKLFDNLIKYKKDIFKIDSGMTMTFDRLLTVFTKSFDSAEKQKEDFYQTFFKNVSVGNGRIMLSHLQSNICINEEKLVTFCHEQISSHPLYYIPSPFVRQNSSIVNPNDLIEITAGIVCFDRNIKPKVYVNNNRLPLDPVRIGTYEFKAPEKSGKYLVPVKIDYKDEDGKQQSFQKEIEYTVAEIVKH